MSINKHIFSMVGSVTEVDSSKSNEKRSLKNVLSWQIQPKNPSEMQSFTNLESFTTNQDDLFAL